MADLPAAVARLRGDLFVDGRRRSVPVLRADLRTVLNALADSDRYRLALESLTPGGSEYYRDPERCVAFVRDCRDGNHRMLVTAAKERGEARAALNQVRLALGAGPDDDLVAVAASLRAALLGVHHG